MEEEPGAGETWVEISERGRECDCSRDPSYLSILTSDRVAKYQYTRVANPHLSGLLVVPICGNHNYMAFRF